MIRQLIGRGEIKSEQGSVCLMRGELGSGRLNGSESTYLSRLACMFGGGVLAFLCALILALPATAWAGESEFVEVGPFLVKGGQPGGGYSYDDSEKKLTVDGREPIEISMPEGAGPITDARIVTEEAPFGQPTEVTITNLSMENSEGAPLVVDAGTLELTLKGNNTLKAKGTTNKDAALKIWGTAALVIQGEEGGSLVAKSEGLGAAIGSWGEADRGGSSGRVTGDITIKSGTIEAVGGSNAAGIGGGKGWSAGRIAIEGGKVTASGGSDSGAANTGGAGIGGGYWGSGRNITITGGEVVATSGNNAASIGGGAANTSASVNKNEYNGSAANIAITGGKVVAESGAGSYPITIGAGSGGIVATSLSITGGEFPVTSGKFPNENLALDKIYGVALANPYVAREVPGSRPAIAEVGMPQGAFFVQGCGPSDVSSKGSDLVVATSAPMEISPSDLTTGYPIEGRIAVMLSDKSKPADITIKGLSLLNADGAALEVLDGDLDLTLKGYSELVTQKADCAALQIDEHALVIKGDGSLGAFAQVADSGNPNGAGIGAGYGKDCGPITIQSGTITAKGMGSCPAIGSGPAQAAGAINISGGKVVATADKGSGLYGAAAIGASDDNGKASTINITGGEVVATTRGSSAVLGGGGAASTGATITISGGKVAASGGTKAFGSATPASDKIAITGGQFAADDTPGDDKVYGFPVADSYTTVTTTDATYQLGVEKNQNKGKIVLSDTASAVYSGEALATDTVLKSAAYGKTDAKSDVTFSYRLASAAETDPYTAGLPANAGKYTLKASLPKKTVGGIEYESAEVKGAFEITQSSTEFADGIKSYKGTAEATSFVYGDTVTVKAKPQATGKAARSALPKPTANQMALYYGATQVSAPVNVGTDGFYTMAYNTLDAVVPYGADKELVAKYVGTASMADAQGSVKVTIGKATAPAPKPGQLEVKNGIGAKMSFDVSTIVPELEGLKYGALAYELGEVKLDSRYFIEGNASMDGSKLALTFNPVATDVEAAIGTVEVKVASDNFEDFTLSVEVGAVNREVLQGAPKLSAPALTYGDELSSIKFSGTMKNAAGFDVPGSFSWDSPETLPQAGAYQAAWTFTPKDTETYQPAQSTSKIDVAQKEIELEWTGYKDRKYGDGKMVAATVKAGAVVGSDQLSVTVQGGDAVAAGTHTATATALTGAVEGTNPANYALPSAASVNYTIEQSGSEIKKESLQILDDTGNVVEQGASFTYGAGVTVKVKPTPVNVSAKALRSNTAAAVAANQMALYYGDVQVSEAVDADREGVYTLVCDTASGIIPVGTPVKLQAKYEAGNMTAVSAEVDLMVAPKVVGLAWTGIEGRIEGDGKQVSARATGIVEGDEIGVKVQGGDATAIGTHTATAVELTGAKAANYQLPETTSVQFTIATKPVPQPDPAPLPDPTPVDPGTGGSGDASATTAKPLVRTGDGMVPAALFVGSLAMLAAALGVVAYRRREQK